MKQVVFSDIVWDMDGQVASLPAQATLELPEDFDVEQHGADKLSDQFGFCVESFRFVETYQELSLQRLQLLPVSVSMAFGPVLDHLHQQVVSQRTHPPGDLDIHLQPSPLSGYGSSVRMGSGPTAEIAQKRAECLLCFGDQASVPVDVGLPVLAPVVAAQFALSLHEEVERNRPGSMAEVLRRNSEQSNPDICHSHDFCDANVVMADVITNWAGVDPADQGVSENSSVLELWNQSWTLAKSSFFGDLPGAYDVCVSVSQTGQLPQQWQASPHQGAADLPDDDAPAVVPTGPAG